MNNQEKHFRSQSAYDIMKAISENTGICPIRAIAGIQVHEKISRCASYAGAGDCESCIIDWLHEESNEESNYVEKSGCYEKIKKSIRELIKKYESM